MSSFKELKEKLAKWRAHAGRLSCQYTGIGPTGGFCLSGNKKAVGSNDCIDRKFASLLALMFANSTVTDLGCGVGQYGKQFLDQGVRWTGYDGAENIESVTDGFVKFMDLTEEQDIEKSDWAMSIEVAEHIPKKYEQIFMYNILNIATKGVVISWALPNQGGHHHVNGKDNKQVICMMEKMGFLFEAPKTAALRKMVTQRCLWLRRTVMVFSLHHKPWKSFEQFRTIMQENPCE